MGEWVALSHAPEVLEIREQDPLSLQGESGTAGSVGQDVGFNGLTSDGRPSVSPIQIYGRKLDNEYFLLT